MEDQVISMKPLSAVLGPHRQNLLNNNVSVSAVSLNEAYVNSVVRSGGIPMVIPPLEDKEDLLYLVHQCDGILLPGGEDVDPRLYGEAPSVRIGRMNCRFDRAWIAVVHDAVEKKVPLMGICRGMQLVNAALGGSLYQDLDEVPGKHILHGQQEDRTYPIHAVAVEQSSNLARLLGEQQIYTNSMHHQCVKRVGQGLKVAAQTPDGIIEALEDEDGTGLLQLVQWHPEELLDTVPCMRNIFVNLVELAKKHMEMRQNGQV